MLVVNNEELTQDAIESILLNEFGVDLSESAYLFKSEMTEKATFEDSNQNLQIGVIHPFRPIRYHAKNMINADPKTGKKIIDDLPKRFEMRYAYSHTVSKVGNVENWTYAPNMKTGHFMDARWDVKFTYKNGGTVIVPNTEPDKLLFLLLSSEHTKSPFNKGGKKIYSYYKESDDIVAAYKQTDQGMEYYQAVLAINGGMKGVELGDLRAVLRTELNDSFTKAADHKDEEVVKSYSHHLIQQKGAAYFLNSLASVKNMAVGIEQEPEDDKEALVLLSSAIGKGLFKYDSNAKMVAWNVYALTTNSSISNGTAIVVKKAKLGQLGDDEMLKVLADNWSDKDFQSEVKSIMATVSITGATKDSVLADNTVLNLADQFEALVREGFIVIGDTGKELYSLVDPANPDDKELIHTFTSKTKLDSKVIVEKLIKDIPGLTITKRKDVLGRIYFVITKLVSLQNK